MLRAIRSARRVERLNATVVALGTRVRIGSGTRENTMRALLIIAVALLLNACALMPEQGADSSGERTTASPDTQPDERLAAAWQQLFDGEFEQANASFAEVIGQTPKSSKFHRRALLGQALVYSDPDWANRDLEQAATRLEQVAGQAGENAKNVAVFDWLLQRTVARLVTLEQRQAGLESELETARSRNRELAGALERTRAEKVEVEQTVARLRELIMGED